MNQEVSDLEESAETQHLPKTGIKLVETFSEWMAPFLNDLGSSQTQAESQPSSLHVTLALFD